MKIRFLDSVAGARFSYRKGQEVDVRPEFAQEFLRSGKAVLVEEARIEQAEVAMRRRARSLTQ